MFEAPRVLVALDEEGSIPLVADPLRKVIRELSTGGSVDLVFDNIERAFFTSTVGNPSHVVLSATHMDLVRHIRAQKPLLGITLVVEGEELRNIICNPGFEFENLDPASPYRALQDPRVRWVAAEDFGTVVHRILEQIEQQNPISLRARTYDHYLGLRYREPIRSEVWINPDALRRVRDKFFEIYLEFGQQTIILLLGGGKGAGKTRSESVYKRKLKRLIDGWIQSGKVSSGLVADFQRREPRYLVTTINTTRRKRRSEEKDARLFQARLHPPEDYLITIQREGYQNGITEAEMLHSLEEYALVNHMREEIRNSGKEIEGLESVDVAMPIIIPLRYPGPQRWMTEAFPRDVFHPMVRGVYVRTGAPSGAIATLQHRRRIDDREGNSTDESDTDRLARDWAIEAENQRVAWETGFPNYPVYDGEIVSAEGYDFFGQLVQFLRGETWAESTGLLPYGKW